MKLFLQKVLEEIRMMYTVHLRIVGVLFFIPVIYTLTFGGLFYKNTLTDVPIIVCNLDDGFQSQGLIRDLYDTPEIAIKFVQMSPMDFEQTIIHEKVSAIVVIPKDYSKNVLSGKESVIELIVDNKNTVLSGTASRAVQSVVGAHNSTTVVNRRMAAGWSSAQAQGAINISSRMLFNPTGGYIDFFLAALIVHGGQIATVFTMGPSFSLEKKYRRRELAQSPVTVLTAKLFVYVVFEVTVMAICLAIGIDGFKMVCRGDFSEVILLLLAFITCMMSFALFVGAWVKIPQKAITLPLFYVMPSVLFSGAIWPRTSMDNFSLFLSYIMPIGYSADDLRNLLVKGSAAGLQNHTAMMLLLGILFFALAYLGVKRYVGTDTARVAIARP